MCIVHIQWCKILNDYTDFGIVQHSTAATTTQWNEQNNKLLFRGIVFIMSAKSKEKQNLTQTDHNI